MPIINTGSTEKTENTAPITSEELSMSSAIGGFSTTGAKKYNPNSIENKNKKFISYAFSRMGRNRTMNSDNFYCNGSYMKKFSIQNLQKGDSTEHEMAIYAVCSGANNNDDACKIAFDVLEGCRTAISASANGSGIKKQLKVFVSECNKMLYLTGEKSGVRNEISIAVVVLYKGAYYCVAYGRSGMYICEKKAKFIAGNDEVVIGVGEKIPGAKIHTGYYGSNARFILATDGIISNVGLDDIMQCMTGERIVKHIAVDTIGKAAIRRTDKNSTCVVIAPSSKVGLHMNTILTLIISGMLICADIVIILMNFMRMPPH